MKHFICLLLVCLLVATALSQPAGSAPAPQSQSPNLLNFYFYRKMFDGNLFPMLYFMNPGSQSGGMNSLLPWIMLGNN